LRADPEVVRYGTLGPACFDLLLSPHNLIGRKQPTATLALPRLQTDVLAEILIGLDLGR